MCNRFKKRGDGTAMPYGNTLASVYDALNDGVDYKSLANFVETCFRTYADAPVKTVCELACGTGTVATELAIRGYNVTASDISEDMLTVADFKSRKAGANVRYVLADMRAFSLYTKADACLCLLDSLNYLTKPAEVSMAFESVRANLKTGGLFLFDVNSKRKFENTYADNAYVIENEGVLCAWQNFYNPKTQICDFYLSLFTENADGTYDRCDEHQRERLYSVRVLEKRLADAHFSLLGVFSDFSFTNADETRDERLYFLAKAL